MNDNAKPIIEVRNLTAGYGDTVIIRDVSFDVRRGEGFVILGGSGSGKSTLLKHIIGLHAPLSGTILIDGENIVGAHGDALQRIREKFGVSYQSGALFGSMNLLENIRLPLEEFTDLPSDAIDLIALMKLKRVGLQGVSHQMPSELSGGMQKRAAIARAMALDPEILFLDEPSAGLDPVTSAGLDDLILRLARSLGITFVIVSHELPSIYAIADRVIMIDIRAGKIVASGSPHDLKENHPDPWVKSFFNRLTEENH